MQPQPSQLHTPSGSPPTRVDRTDRRQHTLSRRHRPGGRRIQQRQPGRPRIPPARHLKRERRQIGHLDLRRRKTRQTGILGLGPAPVHRPRRLTPGPPRPLPPGRLGRPYRRERAQPAGVIDPGFARQPRVDDHPYAGNRQRGLRHGRRQHHPPPRPRGQHRVLHGRRCPTVHLEHLGPAQVAQLPRHARDLPDPGQETQHVPVPFAQCPPYRRRHVREQRRVHAHAVGWPYGTYRRGPDDLHRVRDALRLDHRGVAQQPGPALRVGRRGRRDQPQLGPQRLPYVDQEGGHRVRVQVPLVALVQDHGVDAGQLLVPLEALEQHTGRDDLHACVPPDDSLAAHGVADALADLLAQQPRHAPGRRPRRDPPRLGDDHPPRGTLVPLAEQPGQRERHQRRLAGAGRRDEHRCAARLQGGVESGQCTADGQRVEGVVADHAPSVVRLANRPLRARARVPSVPQASLAGAFADEDRRPGDEVAAQG